MEGKGCADEDLGGDTIEDEFDDEDDGGTEDSLDCSFGAVVGAEDLDDEDDERTDTGSTSGISTSKSTGCND